MSFDGLGEGGRRGGESAARIIACSAWRRLPCGQAVACRFLHSRHGNMHVCSDFAAFSLFRKKKEKKKNLCIVTQCNDCTLGANEARLEFLRTRLLFRASPNFTGGGEACPVGFQRRISVKGP